MTLTRDERRRIALEVCTPEQLAVLDAREMDDPVVNAVEWLALIWRTLTVIAIVLLLMLWRVW